jgi:hypothetical protein
VPEPASVASCRHGDRRPGNPGLACTRVEPLRDIRRKLPLAAWRERRAPKGLAFPGDPRGWERKRHPTARLSPLGERILGLRRWAHEEAAPGHGGA